MNPLPPSWSTAKLEEVAELNPRHDDRGPDDETMVSFLPMSAVEAETTRIDLELTRAWSSVKKGYTRFRDGDVLFAKITPCMENGKIAICSGLHNGFGAGSTEFHVARPNPNLLDGKYLLYYLLQKQIRQKARSAMQGGVGHLRVPADFLAKLNLPVPSPSEQRRIVAEIEKQFTILASTVQTLRAIVGGRTNNVRARLLADMVQSASGNDRPLASLLSEPLSNGRSVTTAESGIESFPVLRLTCVRGGRIDTDQFKQGAWSESTAHPFLIRENDFLIIRGNGSRSLVGRAGIAGKIRNSVAYPDTLIRARFNESLVHLPYIAAIWNSMYIRRQIEATARTTAGIYKINQKDLCELTIPLPDLATQKSQSSIWGRYDSVLADTDVAINHASKSAERLRQSILKKAFSGQLVPQDPNNEPASIRLERIGEQHGKVAISTARPARRQKPVVDCTAEPVN